MRPLKQPDSGSIVDPLLVDEMFYQIPEILEHHEHFLEQVAGCVGQWHDRQTVGHLLIQSVGRDDSKLERHICTFKSHVQVLSKCEAQMLRQKQKFLSHL